MKFKAKAGAQCRYDFSLTGGKAMRHDTVDYWTTCDIPVKAEGCSIELESGSELPQVPSPYPDVTAVTKGRQFRLTWKPVWKAEKYGLAVYESGKWRVKVQFDKNVTSYTSPKLKAGNYQMVLCAKVNGEWCKGNLLSRSFRVMLYDM